MNRLEEYVEYLKDNPEGYWFKCKLHGFGWMPATTKGWATLTVYLVFVLCLVSFAPDAEETFPVVVFGPITAATILLLTVAWRTGEPLKWKWGNRSHLQD